MPDTAIKVVDLSRSFNGKLALDAVSLSVPTGTSCALLGPNGAGKTTLISILCTLLRPDRGQAEIAGVDVMRRPTAARRNIGVVFQDSSLDDRLTAWENLEFHGLVYGMPRRDRARAIDQMLALVELSDWREAIVRSFSGGMKRRLEIARALLHAPRILFLDEPTVGLDAQTRARIWAYLTRMQRERALTVLITTHYIEEVEDVGKVCILDHGRILAEGTPAELKHAHGRQLVRLMPRDAAAREAVLARHPAARTAEGGRLLIDVPREVSEEEFADRFLGEFGSRLSEIGFESPSLESVFLSLTGRELRDRTASRTETEAAAGRRAGRR